MLVVRLFGIKTSGSPGEQVEEVKRFNAELLKNEDPLSLAKQWQLQGSEVAPIPLPRLCHSRLVFQVGALLCKRLCVFRTLYGKCSRHSSLYVTGTCRRYVLVESNLI